METHQNKSDQALVRGMLTGFVVGGLVALWNMPRSGSETRRLIRERLDSLFSRVQGESVEESIEMGKAIAHQNQSERASSI